MIDSPEGENHGTSVDSPGSGRLTRDALLKRGLGIALLSGGALGLSGRSAGSAMAALDRLGRAEAGTVNFFSWEGYDLLTEPAMKKWRAKNQVTIHSTYVSDHNQITAKFVSGGGKGVYNMSTYDAGYGPSYHSLGILSPIDLTKIPNFNTIYPVFRSGAVASTWWNFSGQQWGIPFTWGLQGLNYDASAIGPPASYRDLLKAKYKGKIGIMDDVIASVVIGAHIVGVFRQTSLYTPAELKKIIAFWSALKKNARSIISSFGDMSDQFVAGDIVAAIPGWSAVGSFAAAKGKDTIKHTVPKEGAQTFLDAFFVPAGAKNTDAVYAYINEALTPEVQAQAADTLSQGIVNPKAVGLMKPTTRAISPYGSINHIFTKAAPLPAIPVVGVPKGYTSVSDWVKAWEAFKAS